MHMSYSRQNDIQTIEHKNNHAKGSVRNEMLKHAAAIRPTTFLKYVDGYSIFDDDCTSIHSYAYIDKNQIFIELNDLTLKQANEVANIYNDVYKNLNMEIKPLGHITQIKASPTLFKEEIIKQTFALTADAEKFIKEVLPNIEN